MKLKDLPVEVVSRGGGSVLIKFDKMVQEHGFVELTPQGVWLLVEAIAHEANRSSKPDR